MKYNWVRKAGSKMMVEKEAGGITYLQFPALEQTGIVKHAFSTRLGGVSEPPFDTMNFTTARGDNPAHVMENFNRMAAALAVDTDHMVLARQTHTTNIRTVTEADAGKGIVKERDYQDIDGLITNVPGIMLVTFYADCVPLYILDPVHKAIGLSHSGWQGTVGRMGRETLLKMAQEYHTRPADVIAAIGPSICRDCYEVGREVADAFYRQFGQKAKRLLTANKTAGKYQLDLWEANRIILEEAGVDPKQIHVTDICTRCNPRLLFSHRRMGERRGNLAAFMGLEI